MLLEDNSSRWIVHTRPSDLICNKNKSNVVNPVVFQNKITFRIRLEINVKNVGCVFFYFFCDSVPTVPRPVHDMRVVN